MNRQLSVQSESIRLPWNFESISEAFDTELADVELEGETSGTSAERTRWLQQSLNKILDLRLAVDGIMGAQTRSAIRSFQKQRGLVADGVVSPKTEAALLAALKGTAPAPASFSSDATAPGGVPTRGSSDQTKLPPGVNYPPPPGYRVLRGRVPREVVAKAKEILRRPDPIGTQIPLSISGKDYLFAVEWHKHAPTDRVPEALKRWHRGVTVYGRANGSLQQPPAPSAPPGYTPSLTRQRFAEAVARKDWREAFLNLNGLNMYEMLRSLDALSPERRNGLVAQRQTYRGLVNMPRIEYAMTVVQTRQLPPVAPGDLAATDQVQTAIEFLQALTVDWTQVSANDRRVYVMQRLIKNYGLPENGAAGLVGNLWEESGLIPNRVEGSSGNTPMRAPDFNGRIANFTAEQIMNRNSQRRQGPKLPGIGLAQWTTRDRRLGLFQHSYRGRQLGAGILFHMDAQIDYLVTELKTKYRAVHNLLMRPNVTLEAASDEVLYSFEIPGAILGPDRRHLPRNDPRVQQVFMRRRAHGRQALNLYRQAAQKA